jgi:vanillin dehydrogenase
MTVTRDLLIGGKEVPALSGRTSADINPRTGEVVAVVPASGPADVIRAVAAAEAAFPGWAETVPSVRRDIIIKAGELLEERVEDFVRIMGEETGGTRFWAEFNVKRAAELLRYAAGDAYLPVGEMLATDTPGRWSMAVRQPAGVVAALVPWNGPLVLCARAIAVALATGNAVVLRPSEEAPLTSGLFLADVLRDAGLPGGVLNVVTNAREDAPQVVEALIADPRVRRVNFTGSTAVGRIIGRLAGENLKPVLLELGGKNPIIVLDDADIDYAVSGVLVARFMNDGQTCMCVDRVIVQRGVAKRFADAFVAEVRELGRGDEPNPHKAIGPLINASSAERVAALVEDAVTKGASVLTGGGPASGPYYPATVLTDITEDMEIYSQEVFGPVASLYVADDEAEAVALADDTDYGLASAVYTENVGRGLRLARQLRHGSVHINDQTIADEPQAPVGGIKDSGFGHFGGRWGAEFFTETRWITIADRHAGFPF